MLRKVENGGIPRGIVVCRQAPLVSYLLFADEYIVFGKASKEEGFRLLKILEVYEKELGQKLNREKNVMNILNATLSCSETQMEPVDP